jgi:hypothetical protein
MKNKMKLLLLSMLIFTFKAEGSFRAFASKLLFVAEKSFDSVAWFKGAAGESNRFAARQKIQANFKKIDVQQDDDRETLTVSIDHRQERALKYILKKWHDNPFDY